MIFRQLYYWILSFFKQDWTITYDGEFGYELISHLPFAYWLHKKGKTVHTISAKDTDVFYYFTDHESCFAKRRYEIPKGVPMNNIHRRWLFTGLWSPPPLKEYYKNDRLKFDKPTYVICNKFNQEWEGLPITYLSTEVLDKLLKALTPHYQVVYCRPGASEIVMDNSEVYQLNDHDFIREHHPDVLLIEELHKQHSDLSFNEVQVLTFANCERFISVQGGYSILCSYFKGSNVVYGAKSKRRTADEIVYKAFDRWYHKFSGTKVTYVDNYDKLLAATT